MKEKDILEKLHENQIEVFLVKTGLDAECDVILENNDMDEFIRFCNFTNNKVAFCEMTYVELEDYVVDEDEIREEIRKVLEEKLEKSYFDEGNELTVDNFNDEINKLIKAVQVHNKKVTAKINALNEPEIFFADIYVIHNGVQVGVSIFNDYMEDYPMAYSIKENSLKMLEELISPKFSCGMSWSEYRNKIALQESSDRLEKLKLDIENHDKAMNEIIEYIKTDSLLLEYKSAKARNSYARRLSKEFSSKYGVHITIVEVESEVNEIYESLKA